MTEILKTGPGKVSVGSRTSIGAGAQVIFSGPGSLTIGDYCSIGAGVKFVISGGDVIIGDWTSLHDNCLILSTAGVSIVDHGWFGQNSVIDGTGGMSIGSGVRVGMYSQLWSHVAAGEQIEGCTLFGERGVSIGDNVWLVGSCIVASGITLGDRLVALIGSNITKSFPGGIVIAGTPASERPNLSFYKAVTMDERWVMLTGWLQDYCGARGTHLATGPDQISLQQDGMHLIFTRERAIAEVLAKTDPSATICDLESKQYVKRLHDLEAGVLKYLSGNKARFRNWTSA